MQIIKFHLFFAKCLICNHKKMSLRSSKEEKDNRKKGMIFSLLLHVLILLLALTPFLTKVDIIDTEGVLVAFGEPDAGSPDQAELNAEEQSSTSAAPPASSAPSSSDVTNISSEEIEDEAPIKAADKKTKPKADDAKSKAKDIADAKKKAEADAKAKADALAKAEADRKAAETAKAEREAKAKADAAANQKKKYADLLGKGKGNNNSTGNQGTSAGDPDGKTLEGISKGTGRVGGGLSGRGIESAPSFTDNSQKTGKVSLVICVDSNGKVSKADFTQKGSTTSDSYLIDLARRTALKYKFSKSDVDEQCGTVTIDFRVQ
jgi:membrane protein involved in colicin uptake